MNENTITQLGLTLVFLAVTGLMALLQRMEQSKTLRIWMFAFVGFALDAGIAAARSAYDLGPSVEVFSWVALAGGSIAAVLGTLHFLGKAYARVVYILGALLLIAVGVGTLLGLSQEILRPIVFGGLGIAFSVGAVASFAAGVKGGAGRWVASAAFGATALYAFFWPLILKYPHIARLEFYLDFIMLVWGANGVMLMHFDRSRQQLKFLAEQELALREKLARTERLESLGRLAAGVAHDFNNVLTIVINGSDLVLRQIEDRPQAAERLRTVRQAADGAVGFTRQLLALGRRRLPGSKPVLVSQAAEKAMRIVHPSVPRNVTVEVEIPGRLAVCAAEGQLEQLFVNLSLNALDAMPDGGRLRIAASTADGERMLLTVSDSGMGMDDAVRERIFDPFFTTKDESGSGLGLAAVYAGIQQLGGEIFVTSRLGEGTEFRIEMPVCAPPPADASDSIRRVPAERIRVAVVDDNPAVTRTLSAGIGALGYRVEASTNPNDALEKLLRDPPDLLLTDVCMPGLDGPTLVERLREKHPHVRAILMTGIAEEAEGASRRTADVCLVKPVTAGQLDKEIQLLFPQTDLGADSAGN